MTSQRLHERRTFALYRLLALVLGPSSLVVGLLLSLDLLGPSMDKLFGEAQHSSSDVVENAEVYRALGAELLGVSLSLAVLNFFFGYFAPSVAWRWGYGRATL